MIIAFYLVSVGMYLLLAYHAWNGMRGYADQHWRYIIAFNLAIDALESLIRAFAP